MERSEAMPIRGSPNGARHPRPQVGARPESVVAIRRNAWSSSIGMKVAINRNRQPVRALIAFDGTEYFRSAA
jgi:hypothetical protein